jgi:23S rRNA A1618 N6-methylase RlmF
MESTCKCQINIGLYFCNNGLIYHVLTSSGTGASCIYPLLGCTLNKNWEFLATGKCLTIQHLLVRIYLNILLYINELDIDEKAVKYAKDNVQRNNLDDRITVYHNNTDKKIRLNESMIKDTSHE